MSAAPLAGVRVLDLSRVLAGPLAGQILGDLGAEVIKVERPGVGDDTRGWGPPWWNAGADADASSRVASYFLCANRNKESIAIDLQHPEGQRLVRELAMKCDVVIENFKVGGLAQFGLDHLSLCAANPKLIYCSITGFGQTGPYAGRAGYDFLMQGLGGLMSITGRTDGESGAGPVKVGVALTDVMTGLYAVVAIQAALLERATSGQGQHIDLALLEVQVAGLANQAQGYLTTGESPGRLGNAHPSIVPYQDFPTADGNMILAVGNDAQFERLATVLGNPKWSADVRFSSNASRVVNREALIPMLSEVTRTRPTVHWIEALEAVGVPCGPINDISQVFSDPQVVARRVRTEIVAGGASSATPTVESPIRLSRTPVTYRLTPPLLGEHSSDILTRVLGLDRQRIDDLCRSGAIEQLAR